MADPVSQQLSNHGTSGGILTTSNGAPVSSLTASLTAGPKGNITLKDFKRKDLD